MQLPQLPDTATDDGQVLRVEHNRQTWALETFERHAPWIVVGTLALVFLTLGVGGLCLLALLPLGGVAFLAAHAIARLPRAMEFSSEGIRISGPRAPQIPRPSRLVVRGSPGSPCELWADDTFLMTMTIQERGPWTPDRLTHFARAAAQRLGVPLVDQRDLHAWDKWSKDPIFRATTRWDSRQRQNTIDFPALCNATPARSTVTEQDHHSMTVTLQASSFSTAGIDLRFTVDALIFRDRTIPFHSILRVGPHYFRRGPGPRAPVIASFQVLTHESWTELFELKIPQTVGSGCQIMTWLAREIGNRAAESSARLPHAEGTESEVPLALRALRQQ